MAMGLAVVGVAGVAKAVGVCRVVWVWGRSGGAGVGDVVGAWGTLSDVCGATPVEGWGLLTDSRQPPFGVGGEDGAVGVGAAKMGDAADGASRGTGALLKEPLSCWNDTGSSGEGRLGWSGRTVKGRGRLGGWYQGNKVERC